MSLAPGNPFFKPGKSVGPTEATLALAYEQRTPNLIAERDYMASIPEPERGDGWLDQFDDLQGHINFRFGVRLSDA